jgi:hypothetical protein
MEEQAMSGTKQQLLDQLQQERQQWEGLLAEVGMQRMETPGVAGEWTMKDTIAHMVTWWRREVALLAAVQRDEQPPDHPPQSQVPIINEWIHRTNRDRPLAHVLRDSEDVWRQFAAQLQELPEETLFASARFAWMDGRALGPGSLANFVGHFHEEHEPLIRAWLSEQQNH